MIRPISLVNEDLHAAAETQDQMQRRLFLDVVVRKGATIFQLFASKDETLLIRRNAFLVLNFSLHVINRVAGLHIEGDSFSL